MKFVYIKNLYILAINKKHAYPVLKLATHVMKKFASNV